MTVLAVAIGFGLPRIALATELEYRAVPDCPVAEELADKARERLSDARHELPKLGVRISKRQTAYLATVTIGDDETRTLTAPTCDEIVNAIAVIMAIRAAEEHEPALEPESKPAWSGDSAKPIDLPPESPPETVTPTGSSARITPLPRESFGKDASPREATSKIDLRVGTGAVFLLGVSPIAAWGPSLSAGVGSTTGVEWDVGLTVERASTETTDIPPGAVWMQWTGVRSTGCILAVRAGRISVRPCAEVAGGLLKAQGGRETVLVPGQVERPWVAVGPALRAGTAALPILDVWLEAALPISVVRERLVFRLPGQPDQKVHETWPVTVALSLSLALHTDGSNRVKAGIGE
jgi:hypothetical protein